MVALVESMAADGQTGEPCLVLSNEPDAGGLARAAELGVPTAVVPHRSFGKDRSAFEAVVQEELEAAGAELICLAGFMRILGAESVARWSGRMLNIHPSLLPKHPGLDTHARALAAGDREHGCTVHEV
ncbi:MAG: formyltransferase family protein, partial [Pseudomonadota bacterium]